MSAVTESQDIYLASFAQLENKLRGKTPAWAERIRKDAISRFADLGFPTTHHEDWKYTNVAPIVNLPFQPASAEGLRGTPLAEKLRHSPFADLECTRLVFVNGFYDRELSWLADLPANVKAGSLAAAFADEPLWLEQHLACYASYQNQTFVALNTAFFEDGAFVRVPKGTVLAKPIYLLFVSVPEASGEAARTLSHPRSLIIVERESQATIIEGYIGLERGRSGGDSKLGSSNSGESDFRTSSFDNPYLTNAVSEIVIGEGSTVHHARLQQESERAFHVATVQLHQERSSNVANHSLVFGAALAREDVNVVLAGEGAESLLNGLYVAGGTQHVDSHTTIDHAKPRSSSREFYRGVLDGKSTGVFNGKIVVRKGAQKTDAKQSNKNLLLSEDAVINTKPQLEIYADDVKCTHGATIGQMDPEAIFYLRSRGIGWEEARSLLTFAFANDILGRVQYQQLRDPLKDALLKRMARMAGVRGGPPA